MHISQRLKLLTAKPITARQYYVNNKGEQGYIEPVGTAYATAFINQRLGIVTGRPQRHATLKQAQAHMAKFGYKLSKKPLPK